MWEASEACLFSGVPSFLPHHPSPHIPSSSHSLSLTPFPFHTMLTTLHIFPCFPAQSSFFCSPSHFSTKPLDQVTKTLVLSTPSQSTTLLMKCTKSLHSHLSYNNGARAILLPSHLSRTKTATHTAQRGWRMNHRGNALTNRRSRRSR